MHYRIRIVIFLLLASYSYSSVASEPGEPGLIGLLELSSSQIEPTPPADLAAPLELHRGPMLSAGLSGTVTKKAELKQYEWSYEQPGAAVYGYIHDGERAWYQVELLLGGVRGWLPSRREFTFHGLSELVTNSLSYLTRNWDKKVLLDTSDPSSAEILPALGNEIPIMVAGTAMVEGALWLLAVVLKESPCASAEAPSVLGAGWVPAYSGNGTLNVWFYSRGC